MNAPHVRSSYPVQLWTGKQQPERSGDRLMQLGWKSNEKVGRKAHSARCISVPVFQPSCVPEYREFEGMLVDAFEQLQKELAHKYVTTMLDENGGVCNDVPASLLSQQAVLDYFNSKEAGDDSSRGKLSGEQIKGWFSEHLNDALVARVAETSGYLADGYQMTEEDMKKCQQAANGYKATMERLAAPQPKVDINTARALKKAVELLPSDAVSRDLVAQKLLTKIDRIINPPQEATVSLASL